MSPSSLMLVPQDATSAQRCILIATTVYSRSLIVLSVIGDGILYLTIPVFVVLPHLEHFVRAATIKPSAGSACPAGGFQLRMYVFPAIILFPTVQRVWTSILAIYA